MNLFLGELGDARVDKHEDTRRKKKQDLVDNFKRVFPGVYDRLINMSQPIHKKYNVAITKQLGRYMEAIVVDNYDNKASSDSIDKKMI